MTVQGEGFAEKGEPERASPDRIWHPSESIRRLAKCPDCGEDYVDLASLGAHRLRDHIGP